MESSIFDSIYYKTLMVVTGKQRGNSMDEILDKYMRKYNPPQRELEEVKRAVKLMLRWGWLYLSKRDPKRFVRKNPQEILLRVLNKRRKVKPRKVRNHCCNYYCKRNKDGKCTIDISCPYKW